MDHRLEPTLAGIAKEAGASLTTASGIFSNRGYLSQATKSKIARAIKILGYRPNQVIRALHGKRVYTIGLIVPTAALPFFGKTAVAIENTFAEPDHRVPVYNSLGRSGRERDYLNLLAGDRADDTVSDTRNKDLEEYRSIRMPIVTIDRSLFPHVPNVHCDNKTGGRLTTGRFLAGGS